MIVSLFLSAMCACIMGMVRSEETSSCPEEFSTPQSHYVDVENICSMQDGKFVSGTKEVDLGYSGNLLIVSPSYGCGNYPARELKCQLNIVTRFEQRRIPMTLVSLSLYRASYCNLNSDQLRLMNVVGGVGGDRTQTICGKRSNLNINTFPSPVITFQTRAGKSDKGFELLIQQPEICSFSDQENAFLTNLTPFLDGVFPICEETIDQINVDSGLGALLISEDYGCNYTYPRLIGRQNCSTELSHTESDKRLVYTVAFMDLRKSSSPCDFASDRLVFTNVEGGDPKNNYRTVLCGTKKNVTIRAREGATVFAFVQGKTLTSETRGAGFEVYVKAE